MKNEFTLAFNEVIEDKQLPKEVILEAVKSAMVSAYRRSVNASSAQQIEAEIDPETGEIAIYAEKEVVEKVESPATEVSLEDALKYDENAEIGGMVVVESTPDQFGRVAAQAARQVIQQKIREAERAAQLEYYSKQVGEIVSGVIQAISNQAITMGLEMKAEGIMPRNQQIPGERFRVHDRIRALLLEVKDTPRGPQIILSRAHKNFLRRLLENEVPEIYHGLVEIRSISREPGHRSKVAVSALQPGVDPVGACVGIRGVRIQTIVRELHDEKIDVIEWNPDPTIYIAKALSPARVVGVYMNAVEDGTDTAVVVVPEDQLSLAIGRDGQNARLAAKLTGWKIDIKSLPEAASDTLYKLQNNPGYAEIAEIEEEIIPQIEAILAKKAEGRPITPEEYKSVSKFVDRVERGFQEKLRKEYEEQEKLKLIAQAKIPEAAYDIPLEKFEISDRVYAVISQAGFDTVGDLMLQMELDPDKILALHGMGPKGMKELEETLANLTFPEKLEEEIITEEKVEAVEETEVVSEELEVAEGEAIVGVGSDIVVEEAPDKKAEATIESIEERVEAIESEESEKEPSLEELFKLRPEVLDFNEIDIDEDEEEVSKSKKKKGKKKKKKYVEIEYDPDHDAILVKKKRKRKDDDWDDNWDVDL